MRTPWSGNISASTRSSQLQSSDELVSQEIFEGWWGYGVRVCNLYSIQSKNCLLCGRLDYVLSWTLFHLCRRNERDLLYAWHGFNTAWHVTIGGALLSTDIASCHISLPLPPGRWSLTWSACPDHQDICRSHQCIIRHTWGEENKVWSSSSFFNIWSILFAPSF